MDALTDGKGNNIFDMLRDGGADGDKFGDFFGKGEGGNWEWPKFDMSWSRGKNLDLDWGSNGNRRPPPDFNTPRSPRWNWGGSGGGGGLGGGFSVGSVTVPLYLILILVFQAQSALAFAGGPGPWPIDPRNINTREDVVKAFEYLSVLLCGPAAKTWTHSTIAEELVALAATHGETAMKLARLYELARYAPLDEPLTRAELMEARRLACDLAGIDE